MSEKLTYEQFREHQQAMRRIPQDVRGKILDTLDQFPEAAYRNLYPQDVVETVPEITPESPPSGE